MRGAAESDKVIFARTPRLYRQRTQTPFEHVSSGGLPVAGTSDVSLEHLIALNDEVIALVRAGIPLEQGLLSLGADLPGRLGEITQTLGTRMSQGESLGDALAAQGQRFPRIYAAVIQAGLRVGRLPAALEELADFARRLVELRRAIGLALLYPWIVMAVAYALFIFFAVEIAPRFLAAYTSFRLPRERFLDWLVFVGQGAVFWGPVGFLVLIMTGLYWRRAGQAVELQTGMVVPGLRRIPWLRNLLANARAASFADLLALLIEHEVPFPEAVLLAAEATGAPTMIEAARAVSAEAERGDSLASSLKRSKIFPPVLSWILSSGQQEAGLVRALRNAAESYRRRALVQADVVRLVFPSVMVLTVGFVTVLAYGLTLFLPFAHMLKTLAVE